MPRKRLNTNEEHRGAKYRKIDPHMNELTIERCLDPVRCYLEHFSKHLFEIVNMRFPFIVLFTLVHLMV